jgi:uncharacterized protein (UPF0548 family)
LITIRPTLENDWTSLKAVRLAALLDSPTALGVTYESAAAAVEQGHERVFLDVAPENTRAARFYQKQGFSFIDEWEPLASHPHIQVQSMVWAPSAG